MKQKRFFILCLTFATAAGALAGKPVPGPGQGWTGVTNPQDLIIARQTLMTRLEELMKPIDTYTVDKTIPLATIAANAETISAVLLTVPHLFPPTTNLYDPRVKLPETLALPNIWKDFKTFYALAAATSDAADDLAHTTGVDALNAGALNLRESCDACHDLFVLPYTPAEPNGEERTFDFDSVFPRH